MTDRRVDEQSELVDEIRQSIAAADVGATELFEGIADLEGIGAIDISRGIAEVELTLPIASDRIRGVIEREIRAATIDIKGIMDIRYRWRPEAPDDGERVDLIPDVRNVIAVSSGKGGVGKSTVSVNLAVALADAGASVGLLDADIYGPNAPSMLGLSDRTPSATLTDEIVPREAYGVRVMSMDFLVGESDPVIWRGPIVDEFIKQLVSDVEWGELDYLIIDLPPGTGDAQVTVAQHLPVAGAVIVTTPQGVAADDAARGLEGFARYGVPILGVVENMAGFSCPDCESTHDIFGSGGATDLAEKFDVPVLGRLPLDSRIGALENDTDESDQSAGLSVPLIGRIQLPRTQKEREREKTTARPPIAIRESANDPFTATREIASRMSARVAASQVALESKRRSTPTAAGTSAE